jgi:hypothetical protein
VRFACNLPDHQVGTGPFSPNGLTFDEISLWNRPITVQEFNDMASHYQDNVHNQAVPPTTIPPGQEQA